MTRRPVCLTLRCPCSVQRARARLEIYAIGDGYQQRGVKGAKHPLSVRLKRGGATLVEWRRVLPDILDGHADPVVFARTQSLAEGAKCDFEIRSRNLAAAFDSRALLRKQAPRRFGVAHALHADRHGRRAVGNAVALGAGDDQAPGTA